MSVGKRSDFFLVEFKLERDSASIFGAVKRVDHYQVVDKELLM